MFNNSYEYYITYNEYYNCKDYSSSTMTSVNQVDKMNIEVANGFSEFRAIMKNWHSPESNCFIVDIVQGLEM